MVQDIQTVIMTGQKL